MTTFNDIADMKRQPTAKKIGKTYLSGTGGFPQPVQAEMKPPRRKVAFPKPTKLKKR